MPDVITSDIQLRAISTNIRDVLNAGHLLRLFRNDTTPTTSSGGGQFTEATFGGYAPFDLTGVFTGPFRVVTGRWQIQSPQITWICTGGPSNQVYGWYINGVGGLKYSSRFQNFIAVNTTIQVSVRVIIEEVASVIACP